MELVERVARALWHSEANRYADFPLSDWDNVWGHERADYMRMAQVAIKEVLRHQLEVNKRA